MLRFCMFTTFYPPYNFGGDGIFVRRLANELARKGHSVDVVHCRDAYRFMAGGDPAGAYDDHPNVTVHGLKSRFGFLSPLATQQTGRPFFKSSAIRAILAKPFDVIHFHNASLFGPQILEYGSAVKLYTMHEYWLVCPVHTLFKHNREPCVERACLACTLAHKRPPQWWRYTNLLATTVKSVDAFIAPSRFIGEKHRELGLHARIEHLPYFVPESPGAASAGDEERPYFLFVGRLEKLKGVQTLIPIFRAYKKARLLIAGTGTYEPELRRISEGSRNIEFLGHRPESDLSRLYRGATALIVPSLWYENQPIVALEAFRERTPVLVRRIGALPELIENGGGFTYGSDEELLAAMDELSSNRAKRDEIGSLSYRTFREHHTSDAHLNRYFSLIRDLRRTKTDSPTVKQ
jgi:glycosyltransferase involved in cell wall biosynthesis